MTDIIARGMAANVAKDLGTTNAELAQIANYIDVAAVSDTFTLDIADSRFKNFRIETEDAAAKTVAVSNVPTECELLIELTYTNVAAITWFDDIVWSYGVIPIFEAGRRYRILFMTQDAGANWEGIPAGEWVV